MAPVGFFFSFLSWLTCKLHAVSQLTPRQIGLAEPPFTTKKNDMVSSDRRLVLSFCLVSSHCGSRQSHSSPL